MRVNALRLPLCWLELPLLDALEVCWLAAAAPLELRRLEEPVLRRLVLRPLDELARVLRDEDALVRRVLPLLRLLPLRLLPLLRVLPLLWLDPFAF